MDIEITDGEPAEVMTPEDIAAAEKWDAYANRDAIILVQISSRLLVDAIAKANSTETDLGLWIHEAIIRAVCEDS